MADEGILLSDLRIKRLSGRLDYIYKQAYETAIKNTQKATKKFNDLTDDKLKGLDEETKKKKRLYFANEIKRNKSLQDSILKEIEQAGATASKLIQGEMTGIYELNYNWSAYEITDQTGLDLVQDFAIYDRNQLASILASEQRPFTKVAYSNLQNARTYAGRLQNELVQSVLLGESQAKVIKRVQKVTNYGRFRAQRIVQTERNTVQSQGRMLGIDEAVSIGVEMDRQWIARLLRTREQHLQSHLEIQPHGKPFSNGAMYPGDPNTTPENRIFCFCVLKPMVKSVSPALKASRERYQKLAFEDFQKRMALEVNKKKV